MHIKNQTLQPPTGMQELSSNLSKYPRLQGMSHHRMKCPEDQILVGHVVLMMQKQLDTRLSENKINLTISPGTAAVKWLLIMNLPLVQLWSLQRKCIMCFDRGLYTATYFSQNMVPLQSGCTGLSFALSQGLNRVGK